ncbi:Uncharacterised protein [Bordetella pertussis]|nr:Uncharacterised protein [Bordetella pertussis]CFW09769.1 Uncharacterised protein [Bordetella pertussis]
MVSPRETNLISGLASCEVDTCVKPISRAMAAARCSCTPSFQACMNTMATARMPSSNTRRRSARRPSSASARTTVPSAASRSSASTTASYSISGSCTLRSNRRGRLW